MRPRGMGRGINNGQLAESLVSSYQRNYPQTSTTLLLVQILISFWKKKITTITTRAYSYTYTPNSSKGQREKSISHFSFELHSSLTRNPLVHDSGKQSGEQRTSLFRAPFNAGTRPGRESFLSAEPAHAAVTSIQSTRIRPPCGWYTQRRPLAALRACMHACMHAAGTKSAIPPPLSHPLSPTLFVSLTVLFAPLCPPPP